MKPQADIQKSIDTRRAAFTDYYQLPAKALTKLDELFGRIEEFGAQFTDQTEFEKKFAESPLQQEYMQMFSDNVKYFKREKVEGMPSMAEIAAEAAVGQVTSHTKQMAERELHKQVLDALPTDVTRAWQTRGGANPFSSKGNFLMTIFNLFRFGK